MAPVIALLSDFGTRDHYAGTMKGVMLGICPEAVFVDLTHEIPAHDVLQGALQLAGASRYFPNGTIFLAVVDPGVGTARRGIAVDAGDYRFVAPDNGLLTAALKDVTPRKVVEVTERRYARPTVSKTFEGRDRFAPAAAWLARGVQVSALGRALPDYHRIEIPVPTVDGDVLSGRILFVDRFGNTVTNIDRRTFERFAHGSSIGIVAAGTPVERLVDTYGDIAGDQICALFGSTDHLELAAHSASAAARLHIGEGAAVEITRGR